MESAIGRLAFTDPKVRTAHLEDKAIELCQLLIRYMRRSERRRGTFEQQTRFRDLEGRSVKSRFFLAVSRKPPHIRTRTDTHLDETLNFERDHCLANRWTTNLVFCGQFTLGREPIPDLVPAACEFADQLTGKAFVNAVGSGRRGTNLRFECHG
jgi:hypothetical protein